MQYKIHRKQINVNGFNVMTYSIGNSDKILLLIHGGPGSPCNAHRDGLAHFARLGFRVVTWDQLGCGESEKPADDSLWSISRYVEEVESIRQSLNLGKINILGQSWGGILGLEYCLTYQNNVHKFIASDTGFDLPKMQRGFERKKQALGEETCIMMAVREAQNTTDHPEYNAAVTLLMHRHMCRLEKWPEALSYSAKNIARPVMEKMFGPFFFHCTGTLREYSRINDLHQIEIPVLIIHGEYDYVVPEVACLARDRIKNSKLVIMKGCSHTPYYENPDEYTKVVLNFLSSSTFD